MMTLELEACRLLVEHAPTMVWRVGLDAKRDYVNAAGRAFTGRALGEERGTWAAGIHPDDVERAVAVYRDHFERRTRFEIEYRLRRHDGVYRTILDHGAPYVDASASFAGFIGGWLDVDESGARAGVFGDVEFFEMSLDSLCITGFDGYFKRLNPAWPKTLGWTQEELLSRPVVDFVHPDDRAALLAARERLKAGMPLRALVNRYRCKDGSYRWFEWNVMANVDRELIFATARDVTEQREAQRVLQDLTESLTTILNSVAEGVIATDANGVVVRVNPVAEKLTGWASGDAEGRPVDQVLRLVDAATRVAVGPPIDRALRDGVACEITNDALLVGRDGAELTIACSCAPMRDAGGSVRGAVLVFRDLTAQKEARGAHETLQRKLILADRMASVGTLAAGVAHEINNPLAYVTANLDLLIEEIQALATGPVSAQMSAMASEARHGAERISKIVRALSTFSHAGAETRELIDVRLVVERAVDIAFNEIRHRAQLVKEYGDVPLVEADPTRLGPVFVNVLVNAAQSLVEGSEANEIRLSTSTDALGRAVIEIRDTGPGIPESVIGRIFEPFFTTKPIGGGTGLGLSMCHNIITGLGGEIMANNRPGGGAVFRIVLPAAPARVPEAPAPIATESAPAARRASVLIVDDERALGVALGRVLREHDVTIVTTAKEALDRVVGPTTFDVILSDLMMPEMSGMALHEELTRRCPQAAERMIFLTGGAFTPAAKEFLERVPNVRIDKPFDPKAVRLLVRKLVT